MICDALQEDEIYEAYLLYASLHGLETEESRVRAQVASYLDNKPDSRIDEAILAFAEDRIVAPPDIVLERWGKSRIYELVEAPSQWRHRVCESWFENGCRFVDDIADPELAHFWTTFSVAHETSPAALSTIAPGTRLQFRFQGIDVQVAHRTAGPLGKLSPPLSREILDRRKLDIRYLPLVDSMRSAGGQTTLTLLVTLAHPRISLEEITTHATRAFRAVRSKC